VTSSGKSQYRPEVQAGSFSLLEFAVTCPLKPAPVQEQVGVVIKASRVVRGKTIGDGVPRLHVEYGRTVNGQLKMKWDSLDGQFKAYPLRRHRPGDAVEVSVLQGKQVEHVIGILQSLATGNWWIFYNGDALGYYPASMFTMLNSGACGASWYGEIYNRYPSKQTSLKTDMGSGLFGHLGANGTAYVRSPLYVAMNYWYGPELTENNTVYMAPQIDVCYTRSKMENNIVYFGGPGGKNPLCIWPKP